MRPTQAAGLTAALAAGLISATFGNPAVSEPAVAFLHAPTAADIESVYPADALAAKWGGSATLLCKHDPDGLLNNCKADGGDHRFRGFVEAGLKLAPKFQLDMTHPEQAPDKIAVVIRFVPPGSPPPARAPSFQPIQGRWSHLAPIGGYW